MAGVGILMSRFLSQPPSKSISGIFISFKALKMKGATTVLACWRPVSLIETPRPGVPLA